MSLWIPWWNAIWRLRPAFSRLRTSLWFATAVAGFSVRTELLGVTSLVRAFMCGRPLGCKRKIENSDTRVESAHVSGLLARRHGRWPRWGSRSGPKQARGFESR